MATNNSVNKGIRKEIPQPTLRGNSTVAIVHMIPKTNSKEPELNKNESPEPPPANEPPEATPEELSTSISKSTQPSHIPTTMKEKYCRWNEPQQRTEGNKLRADGIDNTKHEPWTTVLPPRHKKKNRQCNNKEDSAQTSNRTISWAVPRKTQEIATEETTAVMNNDRTPLLKPNGHKQKTNTILRDNYRLRRISTVQLFRLRYQANDGLESGETPNADLRLLLLKSNAPAPPNLVSRT